METSFNCAQMVRYMSDYIDQDLDGELYAAAEAHLASCKRCRVVLDTTEKMILLYREHGRELITTSRHERLFQRLKSSLFQENSETAVEK